MFEFCPKINRKCAMCGKSTYNPEKQAHDGESRLFCGFAPPSYDTTVESLPKCPLTMERREVTKYKKQKRKNGKE